MHNTHRSSWESATLSLLLGSTSLCAIEFGNIEITQLNSSNSGLDAAEPAVSVQILPGSTTGFTIRGANRGDTDMGFGEGANDIERGLLLPTVSENARNNFAGGDSVNGWNYANTSVALGGSGYFVPTHNMGGSAQSSGGRSEYNINYGFGYFPYVDFLGAHGNQTSNGGALSEVRGSAGITLGNQLIDNGNGVFGVDLSGLTTLGLNGVAATPDNGVLLTVHGKNEGNFTMGQDNEDGTFTVSIMDNGTYGGDVRYEQDTLGFVYIPTNAAGRDLITAVGRIQGDGTAEVSGGNFTVTPRRSISSLGSVLASGSLEAELTDVEANFAGLISDFSADTYLLEILSGPDAGAYLEVTASPTGTTLTVNGTLTAAEADYPVDYRLGVAGHEYLLEIPGKSPANGTLLVTPEGGVAEVTETEITTGTLEAGLVDDEATFQTSLGLQGIADGEFFLEITNGPDANGVFEVTDLISDTEIEISGTLQAIEGDYPLSYRIFSKVKPDNTDNFVSYEWDATAGAEGGWVIQSRDVPRGFITEKGATADEDLFSFVFLTSEPDNGQPSITLDSALDGAQIVVGSTQTISATAVDEAPGSIAGVEFFINGVSQGVDTTAPYEVTNAGPFNSLESVLVEAVATDNEGARTAAESVTFSVVPPAGSGGLYFNGVDQYVTFGDEPSFKLSTFTLETWFKPEGDFGIATSTGSGGVSGFPLVTKGRGEDDQSNVDANYFLGIQASDGVLVADFEDLILGTNSPVVGQTPVEAGVWQHAAVTFDGTTWNLYLNGNLEATKDAEGLTPRADSIQHAALATAMNSEGEPAGFFQGYMDESRIWDRALSQSEIREKCNFEVPMEAGLVGRFAMTEGSGVSLSSTASGVVTGNLVGSPSWVDGALFSNNVKPNVIITQPGQGDLVDLGETVEIVAVADDPDGSIAQVEFFDNGVSLAVDAVAPYELSYVGTESGSHLIKVVATDNGGQFSYYNVGVQVILPAPNLSGYTVGIYDGGSSDLDTPDYTPAGNDSFTWVAESSTSSPAFGNGGGNRGDLSPNIEGASIAYTSGLILGTNHPTLDNLASLDNTIAPERNGSGNYYVSVVDSEGPGADEPTTAEESGRLSVGYFPWADGWVGANVNADGSIRHSSFNFPEGTAVAITKPEETDGIYEITGLPTAGNMIAITGSNGSDNITSVAKVGEKWVVNSRDNNSDREDEEFAFLYVPYNTRQVMSGLVDNDGNLEPLNRELELLGASVNLGAQGYEITIGDGSVINPSNSVLFVTADYENGAGGDNVYSYFSNGNAFVVFSHDAPFFTSQFQKGGFRFLVMPLDPVELTGDEVVVVATDPTSTEGGDSATLTFTRFGDASQSLTIPIGVSGSATAGSDYAALPGTVTFEAGSSTALLEVSALEDGRLELPETVTVTLQGGAGYDLGAYVSATVTLVNVNPTVATTTVSFQEGVDGYTGQFGKRVGGNGINELGSSVQAYYLDGLSGDDSFDINGIVRFDNIFGTAPGQIPPGAGIQDAQLIITTSTAGDAQSPGPYIVDQLVKPVTEETTYADLQFGEVGDGFEGVRGSGTGFPVAGFGSIANGEVVQANVTQLVQNWSNGAVDLSRGYANEGFSIYTGGTANGWSYNTVGNDNPLLRPKLQVTYTTDTTLKDYFFFADQNSIINNSQGNNNTSSAALDGSTILSQYMDLNNANSGTTEALLRFPVSFGDPSDLNSIPDGETVIKAELLMTTNGPTLTGTSQSQGRGPYAIHQMLVDWDVTTTFGLTGPVVNSEIGEAVTRLRGMGQLSTTYGDITPVVQNWRAGAPNYGVNLKPEDDDGWQPFWMGAINEPGYQDAAPILRVTTAILEATPFDDYMAANGAAGANFLDDRDKDGIVGLLEYALGLDPTAFDVLPGLVADGSDFKLSFAKGAAAAADSRLSYVIETSPDLENWTPVVAEVDSSTEIMAMIPGPNLPSQGLLFARIQVDYN
ncbi:LamG-like jellyroll fold domain-containing protein [Roseibacillus persicicus]|uniref:LamG-like jellyroll fold domain-containing protein n=1 Tax=Roseibacillus persicicus TaxID=454148 RepID=UPI00398AADA4